MRFVELAEVSGRVGATSKRNEKVGLLAEVLARLAPDEIVPAVAFLTGTTPLGRVGVGWATLAEVDVPPADEPVLEVVEVDRRIRALAALTGDGVVGERRRRLGELLARATGSEQQLLRGVLRGELRQGALDGVMTSAIAGAAQVPVAAVRRAVMLTGDLGAAASIALTEGRPGLEGVALSPLRPVQPMLASTSSDVGDAFDGIGDGPASVEWKLDGARIQAHRDGDDVRLFTRNLNDVTRRLPGVVEVVRSLPVDSIVLDGEVLGVDVDGVPRAFQDTMGDFSADLEAADGVVRGSELRPFFFDVMYADGDALHDEPLAARRSVLDGLVPEIARIPAIVTADPVEAQRFFDDAVARGHEGAMVKGLDTAYEAGRRGKGWRKVKPVHTLDLVVLAVEWGSGRRRGWLSNIHLGARATGGGGDGGDGTFVMVGKTFKGMTDDMLRWQTERFTELKIGEGTGRERHVVFVEPVQVVEIAVDGVQRSTTYPGGVALRFARVRRYRDDKTAAEADTIEAVQALL